MGDDGRTKQQLLTELEELRRRVVELEVCEAERNRSEERLRQAREELRGSQQQLALVLDTAPLGIYEYDLDGRILKANGSSERLTGYGADELIGTHFGDHFDLGPDNEALTTYLRTLATEQPSPSSHFTRVATKNGRSVEVQVDWAYRRNGEGEVIGFLGFVSDITARIEAESALQESEDRYRILAETLPQAIWFSDAAGVFECNRHWYEYTGQTPAEARGHGWMAAVHPDDLAEVTEAMLKSAIEGTYQAEYRLRRASDGSYRWHLARAMPMKDKHGNILYWFGIATDIEDQKQANDELERRVQERTAELAATNEQLRQEIEVRKRAEEESLRAKQDWERTFDCVPDLIAILDDDYRILRANQAMARRLGLTPEACRGTKCFEVVHGKSHPPDFCPHALTQIDHQDHVAETHEDRLGGDFIVTTTPMFDEAGELLGSVHVARDITERKRAEAALRQSEEMYRTLVEACPDAVVMSDPEGTVIFASRRAVEQHRGSSPEEFYGRPPLDFVVEQDRERMANDLRSFLEQGVRRNEEYIFLRKDGTSYAGEITAAVLRDVSGNPTSLVAIIRDITERKQAEETLRQSEESLRQSERRFRNYFEQGLIGMGLSSLDKQWLEVNDRLCEILGRTREELLHSKWAEHTHPDDLESNVELFNRVLAGEIDHYTLDKRFVRRDGSIVFTTLLVRAFRKEDASIDHMVTLVEDITARKLAEDALRQSEEKYRILVEMLPDAVFMTDLEGHITYASCKALQMYGAADVNEMLDKHPSEFFDPEDHQTFVNNLRRTLEEGATKDVEYTMVRKDGTRFLGEASAVAIKDLEGRPRGFVAILRDVTERQQAQEALRQSHEELRAIHDSIGDGLLVADRETLRLVRANAAMCSMLGYSKEELLSMSIPDLHPKEALPDLVVSLQTGLLGRLPAKSNVPMLRKNSSVFYADITGDTFTYHRRPCCLGVFRDVTERRATQEALLRERRTLKHLLRASDHERQLIAYDIHDGLAQRLAGAIMQFQTYDHLKNAKPKEAARAFEAGVTHLRQGNFETRRLISGVRPPILDESGIVAAIAHLVNEQSIDGGPKVKFHSKVDFNRLAPILENAVYRIVQEGLANARKHSRSEEVHINLLQRGGKVRIVVTDSGIGFDPKVVHEKRYGLPGIRERARVLGGKCRIRSKPSKGTAIIVELPLVEREEDE